MHKNEKFPETGTLLVQLKIEIQIMFQTVCGIFHISSKFTHY